MPFVGKKHFDYTPEGMKAAKQESAATGKPMKKKVKKKSIANAMKGASYGAHS